MAKSPQPPESVSALQLQCAQMRIRDGLPPSMPAKVRTHHFGVYTIIRMLRATGQAATTKSLSDLTGIYASHIAKICKNLTRLGLIHRTVIVASHGKGHLHNYEPETDLQHLTWLTQQPPIVLPD